MNYFSRIIEILLDYSKVFEVAKREHVIKAVLFFISLQTILMLIDWTCLSFGQVPANLSILKNAVITESVFYIVPIYFFAINIISLFVFSLALWVVLRFARNRMNYTDIIRKYSYSSVPFTFTAWIPAFSVLTSFWTYYMLIRGVTDETGIRFKKGLMMLIIAAILTGVIMLLGVLFMMNYIGLDLTVENLMGLDYELF